MTEQDGHGADTESRDRPVRAVERDAGAIIVRLTGELDLYNAEPIRAALLQAVAEQPERLVVDLSAVRFMDSSVLGALIEARSRLPESRAFLLAGPRLETSRALEISGLDRYFVIHETVGAALAAEL
jgi:anti-sigma B factor antagonist